MDTEPGSIRNIQANERPTLAGRRFTSTVAMRARYRYGDLNHASLFPPPAGGLVDNPLQTKL